MSDRLSLRGAPVPMMTEGVGETECFADALIVSAARSAFGGRFFMRTGGIARHGLRHARLDRMAGGAAPFLTFAAVAICRCPA